MQEAFGVDAEFSKKNLHNELDAAVLAAYGWGELELLFKGKGAWKKTLPRILETLEALGRARRDGAFWRP
jgi:hypothetical protein